MFFPAHQVTVISVAGQTFAIPALAGLDAAVRYLSYSDADAVLADTDVALLVEPPLEWLNGPYFAQIGRLAETILVACEPSKSLLAMAINRLRIGGVAKGLEDENLLALIQARLARKQRRKQQMTIAGAVNHGQ